MHPLIKSYFYRSQIDRKEFTRSLIQAIEAKTKRKAKIFSWPYNPGIYTLFDRSSSYPLTNFIWYHQIVEKDRILSRYHICNRSPKHDPDIIFYKEWIAFGFDSNSYGKCLIDLQSKRYFDVGNGIFVHNKHRLIAEKLFADPSIKDKPYEENWDVRLNKGNVLPLPLPLNATTYLIAHPFIPPRDSELLVKIGTYNRINQGSISVCINSKVKTTASCSPEYSKSTINDNSIIPIKINGLPEQGRKGGFVIAIKDKTNSTSILNNQVAIYIIEDKSKKNQNEVALWRKKY